MHIISNLFRIALLTFAIGVAATAAADGNHTGEFTKKSYRINGSWTIVQTDEGRFLELDERFKTRNAPDLKIFLSRLSTDELGNGNAVSQSVLIAPLKSNRGTQRYRLPDSVDLDDYQSVLIHCQAFSKLWGVSPLHSPVDS